VVALLTVTLFSGSQLVLRRRYGHRFRQHLPTAGIIITVAGTIYGTILGFMTVVAWQHYQEARDVVVAESDADIDAWHTAVGLPPVVRERVRADMIQYANLMVNQEWRAMRHGSFQVMPAIVGMDAIDAVGAFAAANASQSNAQNATMQQLTIIHDSRQRRVAINDGEISWFQWLVLIEGALWITCLAWVFGMRHMRVHVVMSSTVVVLLASMLVLLFELQYPFRSDIGIKPTAWYHAVEHIHQMQASEPAGMQARGDMAQSIHLK
jgi:hypothetical protein